MSNNVDATNMIQAIKRDLKPKLRFPKFRDAGEWDKDELRKVSVFVNERMPLDQISLSTYVSTVNILPDYEGLETASKLPPSGSATRFKKNDILISNIRPYLKKVWFANKEGGASNDVIVVRAKENVCDRYLSFILKNDVFIEYVMKGAKGVKMPRGDIFLMQEYPLAYPSKPEQQKIAECLSSIDELITAQTQKLNTLKTHKKGLMQQLFPAVGETLPKLRFPEFCDAGEWERMKLGEAATFYNGKAYKQEELLEWGKYKVLRVGNFFTNNNWYYSDLDMDETKYCDNGDLLYAWSASFGPRIWEGEKVIYHYHIWKVVRKKIVEKKFLFLILEYETERIKEQTANGLGLLHITKGTIEAWESSFPGIDEQKKIAECLSSIDELITAQTQKLDTLKTHKKGLMQQLFPTLEEVQR